MVCACDGCYEIAESYGLCESHSEEYDSLKHRDKKKWLLDNNISLLNECFRPIGREIEDICGCGRLFIRRRYGMKSRSCPICIAETRRLKAKSYQKLSRQAKLRREVQKNLPVESDPRYKPYRHTGTPIVVQWNCERPGCINSFSLTLLQHKKWYFRYCERCRER